MSEDEGEYFPNQELDYQDNSNIQIQCSLYIDRLLEYLVWQLQRRKNTKRFLQRRSIDVEIKNEEIKLECDCQMNTSPQNQLLRSLHITFAHFTFENVIVLSFFQCDLQNCQFLSYMDFPALRFLTFMGNNLCTIQSLKKTKLPQLGILIIDNSIGGQFDFSRHKFDRFTENFSLKMSTYFQIANQDISFMAKISNTILNMFYIGHSKRINQKKVKQVLFQRFPQSQLMFQS